MKLPPRLSFVGFIIFGCILPCSGQKFSLGTCPGLNSFTLKVFTIDTIQNIPWREIARTKSIVQKDWKCVKYDFLAHVDKQKYAFSIEGITKGGGFGRASGELTVVNPDGLTTGSGTYFKMDITYGQKPITINYYIVRTNSVNTYLTLYACENYLFGKIESAIVLVAPELSDEGTAAAIIALNQYGIDRSELKFTYTSECL
ncbi:uncharacterized protein LOC124164094 [Ischnura elegans]|uniref:uncharacterized protein LOC124164094 n=1 Tax=Ischnura elegans TaxID=197161 RepID=UPI001ED86F5E|nr:uncharacterized protein LOC124164094 [Ischnura elegans]